MSSNDAELGKPDRFSNLCQTHGDQDLADLARSHGLSEAAAGMAYDFVPLAAAKRNLQRLRDGHLLIFKRQTG